MTHPQGELAMEALAGLLSEFRRGNIIAPSAEKEGMDRHAGSLSAHWDDRFSGFPADDFPYASFRGVYHRNRRDGHLKDIIVQSLADSGEEGTQIRRSLLLAALRAECLSQE